MGYFIIDLNNLYSPDARQGFGAEPGSWIYRPTLFFFLFSTLKKLLNENLSDAALESLGRMFYKQYVKWPPES